MIDIIVVNRVGMVLLSTNKPPVDDFILLIMDKEVEWFDDGLQVNLLPQAGRGSDTRGTNSSRLRA